MQILFLLFDVSARGFIIRKIEKYKNENINYTKNNKKEENEEEAEKKIN